MTIQERIENCLFALSDAYPEAHRDLTQAYAYDSGEGAEAMLGEAESSLVDAYVGHYVLEKVSIACVVYWWLTVECNGQGSREYAALSTLAKVFKPGLGRQPDFECAEARLFDELNDDHAIALAYAIAGEGVRP
jgi:hypothetical protein